MSDCRPAGLMLVLLATISMGCASSTLLRDPGRLIGRPKSHKFVSRILCLWEPAQGTGVDGKPARGFAGQVLFFGPGSDAAVRVSGEVRISEFDDFNADDEDAEPLHTFNFTPDAWDVHGAEGTIGHSYSVFIPFMKKHNEPTHCALKVEFVNEQGLVVASDITEVMLPGKKSMRTSAPIQRNIARSIQHRPSSVITGSSDSAQSTNPGGQLETTTIRLPGPR